MAFTLSAVNDISYAALDYIVRGDMLLQTKQDRPLLAFLNEGKETFPGGKQYITKPVQFTVMQDTAGFFVGYTGAQVLTFANPGNMLRCQVAWKQTHAGFVIGITELLQDGISVVDGEQKTSDHSGVELTRLTAILKNRLMDYAESWSRAMNLMLWQDGTQDSLQIPGIQSIIVDDPTTSTSIENLNPQTYVQWRNRAKLNLAYSAENQTLTKFLRNEIIQLTRYGGRPNKLLCGSRFWDGLMQEVSAKGIYTQSGFTGNNDIGMRKISIQGIGTFEYDPTLDQLGYDGRCYVFDSSKLKLMPIEGEENKVWAPARPYEYMVMLKSTTFAGGLISNQLNGQAVYGLS